jgi:hypothetical protein
MMPTAKAKSPNHVGWGFSFRLYPINPDGHHPAVHRNPQEGLVYADCRTETGISNPAI